MKQADFSARMSAFRAILTRSAATCFLAASIPAAAAAQAPPQEDPPAEPQAASSAAGEASADASTSGDIVVTARRREESLQDVPIAITVATQGLLEQLAITDPESLAKLDPALVLAKRAPTRNSFTPFIRAQGASIGGSPSVITYFSEIPFFRPSFVDLQNVQVLKGPQGTLFGETATGGVVLFTPKKPGNEFEGYFTGEAGNFDYRMLEGAMTLPILRDLWSVRVAGQIRKRRGYTQTFFSQVTKAPVDADNVDTSEIRVSSNLRLGNLDVHTIFAQANYSSNATGAYLHAVYDRIASMKTIIPSATATGTANYIYWTGQSPPAGLSYFQILQNSLARQQAAGPRVMFANSPLDTVGRFRGVANIMTFDLSDQIRIRNLTGAFRNRTGPNTGFNPDASDAPVVDVIGSVCLVGISPSSCRVNGPLNFSNEFQVQANLFDDRLAAQGGLYYRKVSDAPWAASGLFVFRGSSVGNNTRLTRAGSEAYAVFGQGTFAVLPNVHLTAGIRKSWDQSNSQTTTGQAVTTTFMGSVIPLSAFAPQPIAGAVVTPFKTPRTSAISYTLSADWKVNEHLLVWATHRRGYKPGGVNGIFTVANPNYLYGPETLKDFELGTRGNFDLAGLKIGGSLVGYRGKYDQIQRLTSGIDQSTGVYNQFISNVAAATIQGIELSLDVSPSRYFKLSTLLAYTDAHFNDWIQTATCGQQPFRAGCAGLSLAVAGATPVVIDHVAGTATARGVVDRFRPDVFAEAPKFRYTIRPTINFGFLGDGLRGASLSANISHSSTHAFGDNNYSQQLADRDVISPSYTLVDLRFSIDKLKFAEGLELFAGVTNLFDITYETEISDSTASGDNVWSNYNEPRMIFAGARYSF